MPDELVNGNGVPVNNNQEPKFPITQVNLAPDGLQFVVALMPGLTYTQNFDANMVNQICVKWLELHPDLLQQMAKQAVAAKQHELAVIQHVKQSRND